MSRISKNDVEDEMAACSSRHEAGVGQHAEHLRLGSSPYCAGAVEVLEHREAALQQIRAERFGLAIGEIQKPGSHMNGDRILEELRIVEREDLAAVVVGCRDRSASRNDRGRFCFRARVVVVPRSLEAEQPRDCQIGARTADRAIETAVVREPATSSAPAASCLTLTVRRARSPPLSNRRTSRESTHRIMV